MLIKMTLFIILSVMALIGNVFNVSLFFGVHFLFGGIFVYLALVLLNPVSAITISMLASSYTWFLWGQPYAIVTFVLETMFICYFYQVKQQRNLVIIDLLYWLTIGFPLIFLSYKVFLNLDWSPTILVALKQSLNGLFNILIVQLVLLILKSRQAMRNLFSLGRPTMQESIFTIVLTIIFISGTTPVLYGGHYFKFLREQQVEHGLTDLKDDLSLGQQTNTPLNLVNRIDALKLNPQQGVMVFDKTNQIIRRRGIGKHILLSDFDTKHTDKHLKIALPKKSQAAMAKWLEGVYFINKTYSINGESYDVYFLNLAKPVVSVLDRVRIIIFSIILIFFGIGVLLSSFIQGLLINPLRRLNQATNNLTEKIESSEEITLPKQSILDYKILSSTLKNMSESLKNSFEKQKKLERRLKNQVNEKTKKLAQERQRLQDILIGTNAGTWEWNVQTGEVIFNERWAEIVGYQLKELEPTTINTWASLAHPEDLEKSNEQLQKHFDQETDYYQFEARMKHKDGHWVWVLDRGKVSQRDNQGNPLTMSGTHQDITDRKQAEKYKNEMLSNLTHELRTPLTVLMGYLPFLTSKDKLPCSEEIIEIAKKMQDSANTLLLMVNDLLDISSLESGNLKLDYSEFDIRAVIIEVVDDFKSLIESKGLEMYQKVESCLIQGDRLRIKQIIYNLLSNALKFTDDGFVSIETKQEFNQLEIYCQDTGIGIATDRIDYVFEQFTQIDGSTTRLHEGTGLGLSISKSLAEMHGGTLQVESKLGKGSKFILSLPMNRSES
jgi:PAS domain S-box-containing protein